MKKNIIILSLTLSIAFIPSFANAVDIGTIQNKKSQESGLSSLMTSLKERFNFFFGNKSTETKAVIPQKSTKLTDINITDENTVQLPRPESLLTPIPTTPKDTTTIIPSDDATNVLHSPISYPSQTIQSAINPVTNNQSTSKANSAPTILNIYPKESTVIAGQKAYWNISATDNEGDAITYRVFWRDTPVVADFTTNTLSHTYTVPGNYIILFIVKDSRGAVSYTSAKVKVVDASASKLIDDVKNTSSITPSGDSTVNKNTESI